MEVANWCIVLNDSCFSPKMSIINIVTVFVNFPLSKLYWPCWWKRQFSQVFHFCRSRWTDFKDDWVSSFQGILKDDGNNWFDVIFIWIDNFRIFVFVRTGGQISKLIGTRGVNKFLKMMGTIDQSDFYYDRQFSQVLDFSTGSPSLTRFSNNTVF